MKTVKNISHIIGIDEAGRGPLAGPVVVAGVLMSASELTRGALHGIKDSKQLTARSRAKWYTYLTQHEKIIWTVSRVGHKVIDRINIRQATLLGVHRVAQKLYTGKCQKKDIHIFLDGGLALPRTMPYTAIIRGDEKIPEIAAASIIAKVTRDRLMLRLHKKYPQYRFDLHKGYGTALHQKMIASFGRSPIHRVTFKIRN